MGITCDPECAAWAKAFDDCVCTDKVRVVRTSNSIFQIFLGSPAFEHVAETPMHVQDLVSFTLGILSVVFFANCFLPQIALNFHNRSSEGLSMGMILVWSLGDICNLTGVLLTGAVSVRSHPRSAVSTAYC